MKKIYHLRVSFSAMVAERASWCRFSPPAIVGKYRLWLEEMSRTVANCSWRAKKAQGRSKVPEITQTVPGFGTFLSVLVAMEIADIGRFADAAHLLG
jgi:hypothetical protein